jgi:hypothetical protein
LKGELTLAPGDIKITLGLRVMPRVKSVTLAVVGGAGSEASSCFMSRLPARAAVLPRANANKKEIKTIDLMTRAPNMSSSREYILF